MLLSRFLLISASAASLFTAVDGSADIEGLVDVLNGRYINGKPSSDYAEAGIFIHLFDGICDLYNPDPPCDYNLKNNPPGKFFGGTVDNPQNLATSVINNELNTPMSIEYVTEYPYSQRGQGMVQQRVSSSSLVLQSR